MASNNEKKKARELIAAYPGLKYTEALRLAQGKGALFDPMNTIPPLTDILRAAGIENTIIDLAPGQPGTLDPFALAEEGAEMQIDEWHSLAPSAESKARLNELLRKSRTPAPVIDWTPKEPMTLAAMKEAFERAASEGPVVEMATEGTDHLKTLFDTVEEFMKANPDLTSEEVAQRLHEPLFGLPTTGKTFVGRTSGSAEEVWFKALEARFPTVDAGNIFMWGSSGTGRTTALRALVSHALGKGWRVSVADVKDDGYADFLDSSVGGGRVVTSRGHGSLDQGWGLRFVAEGEVNAMDFIASLEPGTAEDPHLVVIDEGQGLLISHNQSYEGGQWVKNLHRLLADPHTVVAFQAGAGGGLPSDDFISLFDSRLMYGRHDAETWELGFRDIAPDSAFDDFAFNASPKSSDLIHGHSRGIFWNGMRLGHVAPEDTLPPAKG